MKKEIRECCFHYIFFFSIMVINDQDVVSPETTKTLLPRCTNVRMAY